jgi:rhodanese-related sulfurtransferase
MSFSKNMLAFALVATSSTVFAQQAAPAAPAGTYVAPPWTYKTKQLNRAQVDALLAKPTKVVIVDVRRPDELISKGSFPVFLSVQVKDVENNLGLIPKDRSIILVSNRAHRAGAVGDILSTKGFKVAGATGTLDYEEQGGTIARITPPPPKVAAAASAP